MDITNTHWKTEDIIKLLSDPRWTIKLLQPGGDVDSTALEMHAVGSNDCFDVRGFVTDGDIDNPDDCEIEMVEINDGHDSRGGWNSDCPLTGHMYVEVRIRLRKAGYLTVESLKDYC